MANNDLVVVVADLSQKATRSLDRRSVHHQGVVIWQGPDVVPTLTGATIVYSSIGAVTAVALDPPDGGADYCRIRVWHSAGDTTQRLYFREDGTAPTADGLNAEGFLLHTEEMPVQIGTQTNFKVIGNTGLSGTFTVYVRWRNSV